ncbi:LysR family transcriptional regulator [Thioclava dalianensis]|uniref:LysR family transcriptional regulator n=1 Tax=Thioclava dalianensis TaxID=1185766 RepID=A0A074TE92_9RHOB|nr:hydrogen peroxide-inducible genes activator [Thioclava dalianensis]KEP70086.1 LysR family transcriptional regulator [Thioclava dalianensis]SFN51657.1 LysR family transcriptional regulator, hydrogen peroxide-inducible genes activator [Thioclava dalianensis]
MNITVRQLTYLRALAEARSFSSAAQAVHVSQPALSVQIRELESQVGQPLVERRPRDVRLTRAGRRVLLAAERVAAELRALEAEARRGLGQVNLGMIPTIAPYLLPASLPDLRVQTALRLREAQTEELLEALAQGTIDAAVIATPAPDFHEEPLFEDRFLLAGTPDFLALNRGLAPQAIDPDTLLLLDEGHCLADQALALCGLTRARQRVDLGASSLSTLCALAGQGMGLTLVPEIAAAPETRAMPMLSLMRFAEEPARHVRLVRLRDCDDAAMWFDPLVGLLRKAGEALVAEARRGFA